MSSRMKLLSIIGLLVMALTSGCDPATGVIRTVKLPKPPSNQTVESALSDLPEFKNFAHETQDGADTWSTRDGMVHLELRRDRNGAGILEMRYLTFGSSTLGELERPRRLMDEVYASLRKQAPDLPPPTALTEKLIRVTTRK